LTGFDPESSFLRVNGSWKATWDDLPQKGSKRAEKDHVAVQGS
jgi:hypothetical protein